MLGAMGAPHGDTAFPTPQACSLLPPSHPVGTSPIADPLLCLPQVGAGGEPAGSPRLPWGSLTVWETSGGGTTRPESGAGPWARGRHSARPGWRVPGKAAQHGGVLVGPLRTPLPP